MKCRQGHPIEHSLSDRLSSANVPIISKDYVPLLGQAAMGGAVPGKAVIEDHDALRLAVPLPYNHVEHHRAQMQGKRAFEYG
jgi:hypothetical protein